MINIKEEISNAPRAAGPFFFTADLEIDTSIVETLQEKERLDIVGTSSQPSHTSSVKLVATQRKKKKTTLATNSELRAHVRH